MNHKLLAVAPLIALAVVAAGCARAPGGASANRVAIAVTDKGFVPDRVTVKAGTPVTLVVTRKTEKTCATEIVLQDFGLRHQLPLNQAVEVTFTPAATGEHTYACGMDMIKGTVVAK